MRKHIHSTVKLTRLIGLLGVLACQLSSTEDLSMDQRQQRIGELIAKTQKTFPDVPNVDAGTLKERLANEDLVLVDVRTPDERAVSMLPGAITSDEFESRAAELEGSAVVTYCTIGYRSSSYAQRLIREGWNASNLEGSVLAWTHEGGELVDKQGNPTQRVHVFGRRWNLTADGYEAIW